MRISIDLDGTLWQHMHFFRELMIAMQGRGHQVGILTGHNQEGMPQDVDLMLRRGFPKPDFFIGKNSPLELGRNGSWSKARAIIDNDIAIHFDDHDFANPESTQLMRRLLGPECYRLITVVHREPINYHYE